MIRNSIILIILYVINNQFSNRSYSVQVIQCTLWLLTSVIEVSIDVFCHLLSKKKEKSLPVRIFVFCFIINFADSKWKVSFVWYFLLHKMDDNNHHILGYSTRASLVKLRDDIRATIEEHKRKNKSGYLFTF